MVYDCLLHCILVVVIYFSRVIPLNMLIFVQVRRLYEFGVTMGELTRYMDALIKDSEQLATMIDSVPSVDNLDFIMESVALGHTVMDQRQAHESLLAVAETVTLEEVIALNICFILLKFSLHRCIHVQSC